MEQALAERSANLLRPDQIEEMEGEREALEQKFSNPNVQDKGAVAEQLRRVRHQLETQRPVAYSSQEVDQAVRREAELRDLWTRGMLSAEEMRKCPPGAVDRHRRWEKENKSTIAEWQNIRRRLFAGTDDRESASIEQFRPTTSGMNMDNALIPGKQYHLPPVDAALPVAFNAEQLAVLEQLDPTIRERLATLNNVERASVKELVQVAQERSIKSIAGQAGNEKKKRVMGERQKAALAAGRAAAKANREAKE